MKIIKFDNYSLISESFSQSMVESNTSSNLISFHISLTTNFLLRNPSGGINSGSSPIRNAFSSIDGIILESKGHHWSNHGFVFASIR